MVFLHCNKRLSPKRRVDLRPPTESYKKNFHSVSLYEYHCPTCEKSKGNGTILAYRGNQYDGSKAPLRKIAVQDYPLWELYLQTNKIAEVLKGMDAVQGSLPQWPFSFRPNIPVYS